MGFAKEFKEFAVKGNVMDLAVGVIIGGAFGKIVDSTINDLVMPLVGRLFGPVDFSNLYLTFSERSVTTNDDNFNGRWKNFANLTVLNMRTSF